LPACLSCSHLSARKAPVNGALPRSQTLQTAHKLLETTLPSAVPPGTRARQIRATSTQNPPREASASRLRHAPLPGSDTWGAWWAQGARRPAAARRARPAPGGAACARAGIRPRRRQAPKRACPGPPGSSTAPGRAPGAASAPRCATRPRFRRNARCAVSAVCAPLGGTWRTVAVSHTSTLAGFSWGLVSQFSRL